MCTGKGPDSQFRERSLRTSVRTHRTWTARRLSECNLIKLKVTGGFELSSGEIAKLGLTYLSRTIFVVAGSESLISSSFFFSFDHDVTICRTHRLASGWHLSCHFLYSFLTFNLVRQRWSPLRKEGYDEFIGLTSAFVPLHMYRWVFLLGGVDSRISQSHHISV